VLAAYEIPESAVDMQRPNRMLRDLASELGIGFVDL
jgi:hypothetical protein